jgi:glycosyltransferase involved in cell wall biosynthesis
MPTVSYVVTLYNKTPFLAHLLAGLAAQEGPFAKQLIFVDDGSTDETPAELRRMTSGWPNVVIVEQANRGPAIAMNRGLDAATGEFIKPLDGDDILAPWATKFLLAAIERTGRPVAFGNSRMQGRYDVQLPPEIVLAAPEPRLEIREEHDSLRQSMRHARTTPSAWLATADIVRASGGCDAGVFIQDYSIELRLAALCEFAAIDSPIFFAPTVAETRLSANQAQILHDVSLALLRFLRANPRLDDDDVRYGLRRAAARTRAWVGRHGGGGPALLQELRLPIAAWLGLLRPTEKTETLLCAPFRRTGAVRLSESSSSSPPRAPRRPRF